MTDTCSRAIYLVGDRFTGFAHQDTVRTLGEFTRAVNSGEFDDMSAPLLLLDGQGISSFEWDSLRLTLERRGISDRILVNPTEHSLAVRGEAHKHRECNVLVAGLDRVDASCFRASLRIHNDNELLLDHQTGQHVQGMVVVEAARQMFLAVTERYYASSWPERNYYYVINTMSTRFENFLFPVDAVLQYTVRRADLDDPASLAFTACIETFQAGRRAAVSDVEFTAFDTGVLEKKEHRRAAMALAAELEAGTTATPVALDRTLTRVG